MKTLLTCAVLSLALSACQSKKASSSKSSKSRPTTATQDAGNPERKSAAIDAAPPDSGQATGRDKSILIPGGPYTSCLGCPKADQLVYHIDAFRIAQDEVTSGEYQACVAAQKCRTVEPSSDPQRPVVNVTWQDADHYCRFVGGRLPTATEWRKAAFPADPAQDGFGPMMSSKYDPCMVLVIGGHGDEPCTKGVRRTEPDVVSGKNPAMDFNNRFDRAVHGDGVVYDMFGNVAEWVSDWYSVRTFLTPTSLVNPKGAPAEDSTEKMICGGSFSANVGLLGGFCRPVDLKLDYSDVGFRCAWRTHNASLP